MAAATDYLTLVWSVAEMPEGDEEEEEEEEEEEQQRAEAGKAASRVSEPSSPPADRSQVYSWPTNALTVEASLTLVVQPRGSREGAGGREGRSRPWRAGKRAQKGRTEAGRAASRVSARRTSAGKTFHCTRLGTDRACNHDCTYSGYQTKVPGGAGAKHGEPENEHGGGAKQQRRAARGVEQSQRETLSISTMVQDMLLSYNRDCNRDSAYSGSHTRIPGGKGGGCRERRRRGREHGGAEPREAGRQTESVCDARTRQTGPRYDFELLPRLPPRLYSLW